MSNKTEFAGLNKIGTYLDEDLPKINENTEITDAQLKQAAQERGALREALERLAAVKPPEVLPATTTTSGIVRLATSEETVAGKIDTVAVTPAGLASLPKPPPPPDATTVVKGIVRLATTEEAGVDWLDTIALTPAGGHAIARGAWAGDDLSGWWSTPSGLIFQWGFYRATLSVTNRPRFILPIKWPRGPLSVWATAWNSDFNPAVNSHIQFVAWSQTEVTFYVQHTNVPSVSPLISGMLWVMLGF